MSSTPTYTMYNDDIIPPRVLKLSDITHNIVDLPFPLLRLSSLLLSLSLSLLLFLTTTVERDILGGVTIAMPELLSAYNITLHSESSSYI